MKATTLLPLALLLLLGAGHHPCRAQVSDMAQTFVKHGYVQELLPGTPAIRVEFVEPKGISSQLLRVSPKTELLLNRKAVTIDQLRCGMPVEVKGDYYETSHTSTATRVAATNQEGERVEATEGRFDALAGGFAYVDGHKVRLAPGKKITGKKNTGYADRTFADFTELKLGSLITFSGKLSAEGYVVASSATVAPEVETEADQLVKSIQHEFYDKLYAIWTNPAQRPALFGKNVVPDGPVVANAQVQAYVHNLGLSLIPPHLKDKLHFMFMVVDNDEPNAYVMPNGVAVVNLGLLFALENEAQLAAVLGHELTHAIYEHGARDWVNREKAKENDGLRQQAASTLDGILKVARPRLVVKTDRNVTLLDKTFPGAGLVGMMLSTLPQAQEQKQLSDKSMAEEAQADRVGLSLLVLAGYDPRAAPIFWKEQFNEAAAAPPAAKPTAAGAGSVSLPHGNDALDVAGNAAADWIRGRASKLKALSKRTHPADKARFESLTTLLGDYYADPQALAASRLKPEALAAVVGPIRQQLVAAQQRAEARARQEVKQRPQLDRQFATALPQTKARLATLTRPVLTYKGYNLKSIVSLPTLVGKPACDTPELRTLVSSAQEYYTPSATYLTDWAQQFKKGEVEPHKQNEEFAFWYLFAKRVNEMSLNFATAASLCDQTRSVQYLPSSQAFEAAAREVAASSEYEQLVGFLAKK